MVQRSEEPFARTQAQLDQLIRSCEESLGQDSDTQTLRSRVAELTPAEQMMDEHIQRIMKGVNARIDWLEMSEDQRVEAFINSFYATFEEDPEGEHSQSLEIKDLILQGIYNIVKGKKDALGEFHLLLFSDATVRRVGFYMLASCVASEKSLKTDAEKQEGVGSSQDLKRVIEKVACAVERIGQFCIQPTLGYEEGQIDVYDVKTVLGFSFDALIDKFFEEVELEMLRDASKLAIKILEGAIAQSGSVEAFCSLTDDEVVMSILGSEEFADLRGFFVGPALGGFILENKVAKAVKEWMTPRNQKLKEERIQALVNEIDRTGYHLLSDSEMQSMTRAFDQFFEEMVSYISTRREGADPLLPTQSSGEPSAQEIISGELATIVDGQSERTEKQRELMIRVARIVERELAGIAQDLDIRKNLIEGKGSSDEEQFVSACATIQIIELLSFTEKFQEARMKRVEHFDTIELDSVSVRSLVQKLVYELLEGMSRSKTSRSDMVQVSSATSESSPSMVVEVSRRYMNAFMDCVSDSVGRSKNSVMALGMGLIGVPLAGMFGMFMGAMVGACCDGIIQLRVAFDKEWKKELERLIDKTFATLIAEEMVAKLIEKRQKELGESAEV